MKTGHDILEEKYRAKIRDTGRVYQMYPLSLRMHAIDLPDSLQPSPIYSERILTVEIRESDIDRLSSDLNSFNDLVKIGPSQYIENIENEHSLRRKNKSVKKAYDNYRMLLRLASEGNINNTD